MIFLWRSRHVASIVALLWIGSSGCAASQPPTPSNGEGKRNPPQNQTASGEQKPTDARGASDRPLIVQVAPTKDQAAQDKSDRESEASSKRWTQFLAGLTVLVGIGQWWMVRRQANIAEKQNEIIGKQNEIMTGQRGAADAQSGYMRDGLAETRKAAETNTNALAYANRPRLIMRPFNIEGFDRGGWITERLHSGEAWITNVGVLPATLDHFWADWMQTSVLPVDNPARTAVDVSTARTTVPPGNRGKRALPELVVDVATLKSINGIRDEISRGFPVHTDDYQTVFLYGYIKFSDAIGLRRTYFCHRYNAVLGRFEPYDHPHYSYEE